RIAAASGDFEQFVGHDAAEALPHATLQSLHGAYRNRHHHFGSNHFVLQFRDASNSETLLFFGDARDLSPLQQRLIELYCTNVAIAFENLHLSGDLFDSQLEMLYLLAGAVETRSQETANHVRRVGLLAELLGRAYGLDAALCEQLRY